MQFILLVYESEEWPRQPETERKRVKDACVAWHQDLVKRGHGRVMQGLDAGATVRLKNELPIVTDGPFAETKEVLGGYEIVECNDTGEAIAIAKAFPALKIGFAMEVRHMR